MNAIRDYALLGDCHGSALVGRDGSVDWCCLGRFDAEPVLCRLLDAEKGGYLRVAPPGPARTERAYEAGTNVLATVHEASDGRFRVLDFMPVGRRREAGVHDYVSLQAPHWLVRVVEGLEGLPTVEVGYRPSLEFARRPARLYRGQDVVGSRHGPALHTRIPLEIEGDRAWGRVRLPPGQRLSLVLAPVPIPPPPPAEVERLLGVTRCFWREWSEYIRYRGPHAEAVARSALALKALTYAPTGAIVAAATTSLPETPGGERNWDYRYCWLRDGVFLLEALAAVGYSGEARRFAQWVQQACATTAPRLQIMYGIDGTPALPERTLDHLRGFEGSRPVRVGNAAYEQDQLDVYGELMDWAVLHQALGGGLGADAAAFLHSIADTVAASWARPDAGIWEMRTGGRHHVFGKLMAWVALDRVARLTGDRERHAREKEAILAAVLEKGVDARTGALQQTFEGGGADASLLLAFGLDVPLPPEVLRRTLHEVRRQLGRGDFLLRYGAEDGLPGREGAFLICSFWLVDALLYTGQAAEARELFGRLCGHANDVGLYAEQIDPGTGAFLGNFPQAFTHLALVQTATRLALLDRLGPSGLAGTAADRARRDVEATAGWRALWAAFRRSGRVGRLRSSRASLLGR